MSDEIRTHWTCSCDSTNDCHCHDCLMERISCLMLDRADARQRTWEWENKWELAVVELDEAREEIERLKDRLARLLQVGNV